jgi:2'-5' RNA ligase
MGSSSFVVVALPSENDPVMKYSSEKKPHLTLCYLDGSKFDSAQLELAMGYVQHAAEELSPFMLHVEERGTLGDKNADVLFFQKSWTNNIARFRDNLLRNDLMMAAYQAADQFPQWTPHLTMGYPETPAKKDTREDPGFWYVNFDRIAFWTGDSEGPEFKLKYRDHDSNAEVAMSQIETGRSALEDVLSHHGVKGMKWGVRKSDSSGGSRSEDARDFEKNTKKIQTHGTQALSNKEFQSVLNRMNMENQFHNLTKDNKDLLDSGHNQVKKILKVGKTIEEARKFLDTPTGKAIKNGLIGAATVGAAYATGGASSAAAAGAQVAVRRMGNHFTNVGN